jgi:hypothetical protein
VGKTFNIIISLGPQADVDGGNHNPAQAKLSDGWLAATSAVAGVSMATPWTSTWDKLTLQQKAEAISVASAQAGVWPINSQPRELLAKLSTQVAAERLQLGS